MGVKNRLDLIISNLKLSGRAFEKECGLKIGSYASIRDGVGADKLNKIIIRFPEISANWLLTGVGEMMMDTTARSGEKSIDSKSITTDTSALIEYLREKDKKIEDLLQENTRLKIALEQKAPTTGTNENITDTLSRLEEKIDKKGESADNAGAAVG